MNTKELSTGSKLEEKLEVIKRLKPELLIQARETDRNNTFPVKSFDLLKENGILGLIVPKKFGGCGLSFSEYEVFLEELASACPSTALGLNMHCIILASMATLPLDSFANKQKTTILPFVEFVYSEVIDKKKVFASATTEPKIGARYSKTKTTYESTSRGYIINGTKSFVSMAEYADYYSIIATKLLKNGEPQKEHTLSFFIVPKNSPGLSIEKNWDTLGLRGTQSQMIHFKDTLIPQQYVFMGMTGFALSSVFKSPNWIIGGYMGAYLGIMKAALETTVEFIKNRTKTESGLGRSALIQARLSDMYTLYQQSKLAIEHCARLVDKDPLDLATHRSVYHAKFVVGENAAALTSLAIKTCGGSAIQKSLDLERYYRDARCASLMPAVSDVCQLFVGRSLLDLPTTDLW